MLGVTKSEYARHAGVSTAAISQSRKLVKYEDGSINVEESDKARAEDSRKRSLGGDGGLSYSDILAELNKARTDNEHLKARERELKLQQIQTAVVDRNKAVNTIFRLSRQERDSWLGWPSRVSSVMAAELGVQPHFMQTVLDKHVREHLEGLAEIRLEL